MPGVIRHLSEKPETMTDVDFLKEDLYSSPKFALDPSKFSKRMQRLLVSYRVFFCLLCRGC